MGMGPTIVGGRRAIVRAVRKLILIADDLYVRNFLDTEAFREIEGDETFIAASENLVRGAEVAARPNFAGTVADPAERAPVYYRLRMVSTAAMRKRSTTMKGRIERLRPVERAHTLLLAHPRLKDRVMRRGLERLGPNAALEGLLDEVRPDVVVAPTAGTDNLVFDALVACARRDVPVLLLVNGWDNMSSKFTFTERPDWLAVWGDHSVRHATEIHGFEPDRLFKVGSPAFEPHFAFDRASTPSPYPFPYILFAGASLPYDEIGLLRQLDEVVPEFGVEGLKIVYRPHPSRHFRLCDDVLREQEYEHVVLDEQVREPYLAAAAEGRREFPMPGLDWYPALLGHAHVLVCPLSTMIVEAGIVGTPVVALAFDDDVHPHGLSTFIGFNHFEGIEDVSGLSVCHRREDLEPQLQGWIERGAPADMRESIRPWLHFDERTYAQRLADVVDEVLPAGRVTA